VLEGKTDYRECGRAVFPDGSFANGGAMRIVPIALAFRNASDEQLYEAVRMAIISSHVHPEGIDGAYVLVKAIILALQCESVDAFDSFQFLTVLQSTARTDGMRNQIQKLIKIYSQQHGIGGESSRRKM
jgi:poly(ADP-ribose) glycohydrolase ARH3